MTLFVKSSLAGAGKKVAVSVYGVDIDGPTTRSA
jgi:hypothetical protein